VLTKFKKHISTNFPFLKGKKILVAVSGGIDSVILTDLFVKSEFEIALAHCNFNLRGKESELDEEFVKNFANKINAPFFSIAFDTKKYAKKHKLSTQMAARKLRYDWFKKTREENNLDYISTAHHLDDNLETFLINFTRGTGLNGLTGIPEIKDKIIRPLLPFSRQEIKEYIAKNKIEWREDASNAKLAYQRNKIRHQIVPILKEMNPNLLTTFQNTTNHLKESHNIINDRLNNVSDLVISSEEKCLIKIDIKKLKKLNNIKAYLYELLKKYGFTQWNDVVNLLEAQSGKQLFSETHRLVKDRDSFLLTRLTTENEITRFLIGADQETLTTAEFSIKITERLKEDYKNQILVDADKLRFPLELRKWKESDYFYPLGMKGKKKISKFFKDEKLSLIAKENTWLLCSKNDIVWVVNKRLDDRFKITNETKKTIQIVYSKNK